MAQTVELENIDIWGTQLRNTLSRSMSRNVRNPSIRSWSLREPDNEFMRSLHARRDIQDDDEEALKWAALEKLPTYDRLRTSILKSLEDGRIITQAIDVRQLGLVEKKMLIDRLLKVTEEDNERFLIKFRDRIDKVGIELPTVEVRFENYSIDAKCHVGGRALPTLWNVVRNFFEGLLDMLQLAAAKKANITILKDINGMLKSSRMTLLLGPPGSGKTSLLLALAGKLNPSLQTKGSITYNGHSLREFVPQKTSAYISQHDLHIGELTVRETLDFSARCQGVGTRYEMLIELARREKQAGIFPDAEIDAFMKATSLEGVKGSLQTDYTLKILGLDVCADTMVGDPMRRGISGGQKKRVTTGDLIVGPTKTLFMDEISTGLDSSTTFQVVKCLRQFVHVMEGTILMSLLQPPPETFELFDDILLLAEGQIVYLGPREHVLEFFETCGFRCPERKGAADFLQEVISRKDQEQYWFEKTKPYHYVPVKEFVNRFKRFHVGLRLADELSLPYPKEKSHRAALSFSTYSVSKKELFNACFAREWLLMKRNSFVYIFKGVQLVIVAFIAMTVFLRTRLQAGLSDGAYYLGALFFSLNIIMFNGFAEMSMTIFRLPVFFKQRDLLFYPAWAYTLPTYLLRIPQSIVESGLWVSLTYYVIGFAPEPSRFFKQYLLLFLMHQMSSSLFRFIGGLCRSMIMANTGGSFMLLVIFMLGGFIIPRAKIPAWWIWGYWSSPLQYGLTASGVNEFLASRWNTIVNGTTTAGVFVLERRGLFSESYRYWIGIGALIGFIALFNLLFTVVLSYLGPIGKPQATISEEALAEMDTADDGGEVLPVESSKRRSRRNPLPLSLSTSRNSVYDQLQMEHVTSRPVHNESFRDDQVGNIAVRQGMSLPFQPLAISFEDVKYFVDMPVEMMAQGVTDNRLQLLRGVTGSFRPGVLTALMGVSGAGKTTLMDVLAGRKTGGYIEGDVRISGYPKKQETFARISGYCEQTDIHSPQVTVHESLIYSAKLRLSSEIDRSIRMQFVDEVMDLVELRNLSSALVGLPGVSGLSTEQRKRLTIAVELVANPSIIFMDEPTSGLDARAAAIVMRAVRNTVDTGRTVVCTIHQPSIDIFEAFDELLLMKRGGQVIYSGPLGIHSQKIIDYFEAVPGVPKIKDKYNPATWMLEASSIAVEQRLGIEFADVYRKSSLAQRNKELVKELSIPAAATRDLFFPMQYCQPLWGQFRSILWKQHLTYWRSPDYNLVRFTFTFISALMFGTIFWQLGTKIEEEADLLTVMGAMYGATLFLGINNCSTVQPVVSVERTVFYRERAAGMYSALPYAVAQVVIELPYVFAQTVMYGFIVYSMIGFEWVLRKCLWFLFTMFCTFLYFTYYGMMAVSITPNHQVAAIVASAFYSVFNLFSGFLMPRPKLPKWWSWYYWLCPTAWTVNGLITSQYSDMRKTIQVNLPTGGVASQDITDYLNITFGFHRDFLGEVATVLIVFPIFFALVFTFCVRALNFQRR
ncbi:hypothetical protein GOP47_0012547 [Adiantum capillus-veneris]|uniref:ABC transporter domain-containing protein n=1 Tax=Adiantum capillus-veneris TaxID=13818 RepID=A0A9D4UR45_ADICA|nr:hypothetical protein GOP47_0012547 [Adiantum capillus-veneris]